MLISDPDLVKTNLPGPDVLDHPGSVAREQVAPSFTTAPEVPVVAGLLAASNRTVKQLASGSKPQERQTERRIGLQSRLGVDTQSRHGFGPADAVEFWVRSAGEQHRYTPLTARSPARSRPVAPKCDRSAGRLRVC